MKKSYSVFHLIFNAVDNWFTYLFGDYDAFFSALIILVVINCITIIICMIFGYNISSKKISKILCSKILIFILVGVANIVDTQIIKTDYNLRTIVILFYFSTEGISILKNAEHLGVPIPKKLRNILKQLYD